MHFKNEHIINRQYNFDLEILQSGYQQTRSNYFFGPAVRSHYLIHYVISGSGSLLLNNKLYEVTAGQAFIIFPNEVSFYQSDEISPFEYTWIGFNGLKADLFFEDLNITANSNPIITFDKEPLCFKELRKINDICAYDEVKLLGLLYIMFHDLLKHNNHISINKDENPKVQLSYADTALDFINKNYYKKISVDSIARYIGLNKGYLGNIFKATFNISIKSYILDLQIKKACQLLKDTNISISEVSKAVGYDDVFQFSKIFKKHKNFSPKAYRKNAIYNSVDVIEL